MTHVLDRPAWSALEGPHASLAVGNALARRYRADTVPFAAARDTAPESLEALAALAGPGEVMALAEANELSLPPAMVTLRADTAVQMVLERELQTAASDGIEPLGWADAEEMLALAMLTEPGPFSLKSQALGSFFGIRADSRIVAMAGERMKQVGFSELSGVCAHPDVRGRGLARALSVFVAKRIVARGDVPYLHAWANNLPAIRLYETIGFGLRTEMNVALIQKSH